MPTHPFAPLVLPSSKKLLIGTLPPEGARFYFSNSPNARLWDILLGIANGNDFLGKGGYKMSDAEKSSIAEKLGIGISDIIYAYDREDMTSTKDDHIIPRSYNNLRQIAFDNNIDTLLFVYQNALKWFIHSLEETTPVKVRRLKSGYNVGQELIVPFKDREIRCVLLPIPLNRGRDGETLIKKFQIYKRLIEGNKSQA